MVGTRIIFLLKLIGLFTAFFPSMGFSQENPVSRITFCKPKIVSVLREWGSKDEWQKQPADRNQFLYYTPTEKIGVWIEIKNSSEDETQIARIEATNVTQMKFLKGNCNPEISLSKSPAQSQGNRILNDEKLRERISLEKKGFIYTWSTAMPLSVDGVSEIKKAAQERKLTLIVVLDKNADKKAAALIAKKNGWPEDYLATDTSLELRFRGAFNHFPSVLFFKDSKIYPKLIPGLRNAAFYANQAKEFGL